MKYPFPPKTPKDLLICVYGRSREIIEEGKCRPDQITKLLNSYDDLLLETKRKCAGRYTPPPLPTAAEMLRIDIPMPLLVCAALCKRARYFKPLLQYGADPNQMALEYSGNFDNTSSGLTAFDALVVDFPKKLIRKYNIFRKPEFYVNGLVQLLEATKDQGIIIAKTENYHALSQIVQNHFNDNDPVYQDFFSRNHQDLVLQGKVLRKSNAQQYGLH